MSTKVAKNKLEISSDQLKAELIEIKERIAARGVMGGFQHSQQ